jgi:hypothetical protein
MGYRSVVRGGPVRRTRDVRVRLTPDEPPVVDAETYLTLVTAANALGELVARANAE